MGQRSDPWQEHPVAEFKQKVRKIRSAGFSGHRTKSYDGALGFVVLFVLLFVLWVGAASPVISEPLGEIVVDSRIPA